MNQGDVTIGVGIPCYNHGRYVGEAIRSVLRQTWPPSELLVIDNGSTDDSVREIQRAFEHNGSVRCRLVTQEHHGISVTRNKLMAGLDTDIIAFLDSDDWYRDDRFERMLRPIPKSECFFALSGVNFCSHLNEEETAEFVLAYSEYLRLCSHLPTAGFAILLGNLAVTPGNFLFSRRLFEQIGPFDPQLQFSQDWDYLLRAVRYVEPRFFAERLLTYRLHPMSTAKSNPNPNHDFRLVYSKLANWLDQPSPNPLAPTPANWPGYLRLFAHICGGRVAGEPLAASLPDGFMVAQGQCSVEGRSALEQLLRAHRECESEELEAVTELLQRCESAWRRK